MLPISSMPRAALARKLIDTCLEMNRQEINQGASGNASVRCGDGFLITPSGIAYEAMSPHEIVFVTLDGRAEVGRRKPSSEWRMHRDIYAARPEAGAVLHAHSTYATALSCHRLDIPAFHYMIAIAGGADIRCADYALFGTQQLSDNMLDALAGRRACLLGTHGMICFHDDLDSVLWLGIEVETLARQYWHARQLGEPVLLDAEQMADVMEKFKTYSRLTES